TTKDTRGHVNRFWNTTLERLFGRSASSVITVNREIADRLRQRYGWRSISVIHNFPKLRRNEDSPSLLLAHIPRRFAHRRVLLYQGRLTAHRGIEMFVNVIAQLSEVVGVIVGSGPIEEAIRRRALQYKLGDRLVFVPQVPWEQLAAYTLGADLGFCLS